MGEILESTRKRARTEELFTTRYNSGNSHDDERVKEHFHVLKYLYEELDYFLGLQRYCKPAIEYGKLEILEWLLKIGIMNNGGLRIGFMEDGEDGALNADFDYCECAIKSGNLESLKWLQEVYRCDFL